MWRGEEMSQGMFIVSGPPGKLRDVKDQPDAYGRPDKWQVRNVLRGLPEEYRRDCSCTGEDHDYFCPDPEGFRPASIPDAREALKGFDPIWQELLGVLERDPNAFLVVR